ncbi:hypothetical protein LTR36_000955 [Oleoguttula mirabilis]|uniref:DUF1763-domain-containing protein n=1 Tax=Oleoguttula mirabilis TaxID=1507867 RepID=A0AAV9JPQ6_9PEZI|nr:hypothetical protein LTR36_000955 [Oleoguttula mirabilis]
MPPSHAEVILAYRHLYQHLLRAVQYSKPARFVAQERIRNAFRTSSPESFDATRIERTLQFLNGAAKTKGLEHKIVKNLMFVWWEQNKLFRWHYRAELTPLRLKAYDEFNRTVDSLNNSMGLCIK